MNRKLGTLLCALGCAFTTRLASAQPAPASYAWCKTATDGNYDPKQALTGADVDHALPAIAEELCYPNDKNRAQRDAIEARRQAWMKRLEMSEADWAADVVEWANVPYSQRNTAHVDPVEHAAWSTMGPIEQFALLAQHTGASTDFALSPGAKHYIADAIQLSQIGRLAYLQDCIHTDRDTDIKPVEWAICQPDIDAFDPKQLAAELRAETGRTAYERMTIRVALGAIQPALVEHATKVKQLLAKDPAYPKLFELAKQARKSWSDGVASRAQLLALVRAMDDARATGSRKASAGCTDKTWPVFAATIASLPAKRFENMRGGFEKVNGVPGRRLTFLDHATSVVLENPEAYLAANALVSCEGHRDFLLAKLEAALAYWPGYRGPRTAGITAIRYARLELDERGATLAIPEIHVPLASPGDRPARGDGSPTSIIASVTDQGDTLQITFPKTIGVQTVCTSSRTTNRISRIDSSGNVYYATECLKYEAQKFDATLPPVTVAKRYGARLAAGMYVSVLGTVVEAVWAKPDSPTPVAVFGVALQ